MPPTQPVVRLVAVDRSAMRSDHWLVDVLRMPKAKFTFSDGLLLFAGCASFSPPQPGSPIFAPPAHTPASKSAIIQGPEPAPLPQNAVPKNSVFISAYVLGFVVTLPKSQQHCVPTWLPSASS